MQTAPLILSPGTREKLQKLRYRAEAAPLDMLVVMEQIKTAVGIKAHNDTIALQTVSIPGPFAFSVTYTVEFNHPRVGIQGHMSMAVDRRGRVPSPQAIQAVAEELGFINGVSLENMWVEELDNERLAINLCVALNEGPAPHVVH